MKLETLRDLYIKELKDIYSAEGQIAKALPKMAKAATSPKLQSAFQEHLEQTREQIERLDQIFNSLGVSARGKKCAAMEGLIEEGKDVIEEEADPDVKDAALIAAAQKVEHYEIASYGTVRTFAKLLGESMAMDLLNMTLDEEAQTDKMLTKIAMSGPNLNARSGDDQSGSSGRRNSSKTAMRTREYDEEEA